MIDELKINIDQLKQGKVERIDRSVPSDFLEIEEPDLRFESDVDIRGEAYIAGDGLVLHLNIGVLGSIPCSICNEPVQMPIEVKRLYHVEPLESIRSGTFNMGDVVRENILLEAPSFAECNEGNCPERKELGKYLKVEDSSQEEESEGYQPFSDLDSET